MNFILPDKIKILSLIILAILALFAVFFILAAAEDLGIYSVVVTLRNSSEADLNDVKIFLDIPNNLNPVLEQMEEEWRWDGQNRILSKQYGNLLIGREAALNIPISGPVGTFQISGRWSANGGGLGGDIGVQSVTFVFVPKTQAPEAAGEEVTVLKKIVQSVEQTIAKSAEIVKELRSNSRVVELTEKVVVPLSVVIGLVGIGGLTSTAVSSSASFAFYLAQTFRFSIFGFLRFKRRKPWGRVYNQITAKPIAGASVKIFDAQFHKLKETQITDRDGRFGFLVSPGEYYLSISRKGFQEKKTGIFKITKPDEVLNIEVPLSLATEALSLASINALMRLNTLKRILEFISPILLIVGTGASIFVFMIVPTWLNAVILFIYLILDSFKTAFSISILRSFGKVFDKSTHKSLPLAVVRIFNERKNWLLGTKVTDVQGRFNFLITAGSYYLTCVKSGFQPFQSEPTVFKKAGIVSFDIKMDRG